MEISTLGQAKMSAATKRQTEIVLPNRRGVDILWDYIQTCMIITNASIDDGML